MKKPTVNASSDMDRLSKVLERIDSQEFTPDRQFSSIIDNGIREAGLGALSSGQTATLTITIKFKPGAERRLTFAGSVKTSVPKPPVPTVTMFMDEDGNLLGSDPAQMTLEMTDGRSTNTRKPGDEEPS